jgi:hypothetical protein
MSNVDLLNVRRALDAMAAERQRLEAEIEKLLQERETCAHAPLPMCDVENLLIAQIDRITVPAHFERIVQMIASRPGKTWTNLPALYPNDGAELGAMLAAMLAPEMKKGLSRTLKRLGEVDGAGLPISERGPALEALDARIEKAETALNELRESAQQAGLSWPTKGIY